MHNVSILEVHDPRWLQLVQKSKEYDFYHTPKYHALDASEHTPVLFVVEEGIHFIAMPFIVRDIPNSNFKDCTSAYGYLGPICSDSLAALPDGLIDRFQKELQQYFVSEHIVTAFSRLHPLIPSKELFNGFGAIRDINKTVTIDLRLPLDEQRRQYRKSNKSEINQLRKKKGYSVKLATTSAEIEEFVRIYHETMKRVDATDNYFFDLDYFKSLLSSDEMNARLYLAIKEDVIAAGAIFTFTNNIVQYHLAGTKEAYTRDTPMKLLIDEVRIRASQESLHYLHLGGGVGGSDSDSLFRFKSGFSDRKDQFRVWQFISDEEVYAALNTANDTTRDTGFFPKYRANL